MDSNAAASKHLLDTSPSGLERAPLTRKNLRALDKTASGQQSQPVAPSPSLPEPVSITSPAFAQLAEINGVLYELESEPPANIVDLRSRLDQNATPSSKSAYDDYDDYDYAVTSAENEQTILHLTITNLLKGYGDKYRTTLGHLFTAFPEEVGFNNGLSQPRPDIFQGFAKGAFRPFPIMTELGGAAVVIDNAMNSIALSHFVGEIKGPGKDLTRAETECAYDAAALVYGRNQALQYLGESDPSRHAAVLSFATDGTRLYLYAHYSAVAEYGDAIEYHQCHISSMVITSSQKDYDKARRWLQNAQDYAKEAADDLRRRLVEHWNVKQNARRRLIEHWKVKQDASKGKTDIPGSQPSGSSGGPRQVKQDASKGKTDIPGPQPSGSGGSPQKRKRKRKRKRRRRSDNSGSNTPNKRGASAASKTS